MTSEVAAQAGVAPVAKAARVESLDILRGVAVLGILMMNITAFGLLFQAYDNPLVEGGATGLNLTVYQIISVGFEGTMRGIFSLLFGAGIVLLTERMEQAGAGVLAADIHFRRMLWLMLFGIIHWTLLLWTGEILFAYSLCGLVLFALRKLSAKVQLAISGVLLAGAALFMVAGYGSLVDLSKTAAAAEAAKAGGATLSTGQTEAIEGWKKELSHNMPTAEEATEARGWHEGSYWNAVTGQLPMSFEFQWVGAPFWLIFDAIPFMLLGMALLKLGVLGARAPLRTYGLMVLVGYGIGIPLGIYELDIVMRGNFSRLAFGAASQTYELSRLAMVIGHIGLLLLLIRARTAMPLQRALGAVGQMALSNYLTQTLICTALFYGFGFGLYGDLQRYQLYLVVAAIWVAQLIWSPLWLKHFRFGPFEWVWRSLTYWQRQPMRLHPGTSAAGGAVATPA